MVRKEMPFQKYNFTRNEYHNDEVDYLMGNAEMGGLASKDGLGFNKLWFADVWENVEARKSIEGPKLVPHNFEIIEAQTTNYNSVLQIKNGILSTSLKLTGGPEYSSKLFFSKANKHKLILSVKNESNTFPLEFELKLPFKDYILNYQSSKIISGVQSDTSLYTQTAWALSASSAITAKGDNFYLSIQPGQELLLSYSLVTQFDTPEYKNVSLKNVTTTAKFNDLYNEHIDLWNEHWNKLASIILPDGENAKWFYRSLYTLYATAGSDHFLPGELQFSIPDPDWKMRPFTYGHAGWSVWAFTLIGDEQNAKKMAKWHYKPEALKENVKRIFPNTGPVKLTYRGKNKGLHTYLDSYNKNAMAFGHNVFADGHGKIPAKDYHWDMQRQLDAFAASFFHSISEYYPDNTFTEEYTYPVLRGTAELWCSLVKWDSIHKYYYLPPLLSVSENILEPSVLDAVLAARWNLKMSAEYAAKLKVDSGLRKKWQHVYENLYIPENDSFYLEYLNDNQLRTGGGYFGIRAFVYLGFPVMECMDDIDLQKANRSLDMAWKRNNEGAGMITFIMNWFAATEAMLGNGNKALEMSSLTTTIKDKTDCALYEVVQTLQDGRLVGTNAYFLTGYSSFIVSQVAMLSQSYNNTIKLFPAVPDDWKDISFYDMPIQACLKASAIMEEGEVKSICIKKGEKEIFRENGNCQLGIRESKNGIEVFKQ